jgi:O-antigen/teichoic acid export membrane protein
MTMPSVTLRTLAVKSAAWYGATRLWAQGLSWGVTIVLARLLTPQDYGLFSMALSVLAFIELFQEFGLGTAIIQRQDLTRQQINGVFWIIASASVTLTALTVLGADLIAVSYGEPRLAGMVRVLSVTFLLSSLGIVPYTLLTKAIDLRRRSLAEAFGVVTSAAVAVVLAYHGWGVWALALGHLARGIVINSSLVVFSGWLPGLDVSFQGMWDVLKFGLRVVGTSVMGSASATVNILILGRMLGGRALGLYAMGSSFAEGPHRISTAVINQVSIPVFARLQHEPEPLRNSFMKISKYLAVVSLPVQIGLALIAADAVPLLLSEKWQDMVPLLQVFSVGGVFVVLTLTSSPLLTAKGRPDLLFSVTWVSAVGLAVALLVATQFGLMAAALAWFVALIPIRLSLLVLGLRELGLTLGAYAKNFASPILATGVMAAAVTGARAALGTHEPGVEQLVVTVLVGAATYTVALLGFDRGFGGELKLIARDLFVRAKA